MTQDKLEGHARALQQVNEQNGAAPYDLAITFRKGAAEDLRDQAKAVLLHELSLEPSRACIYAALDAMYGGNLWRGHPNAMQLCEDMSAALRAYQAQRKREIKG